MYMMVLEEYPADADQLVYENDYPDPDHFYHQTSENIIVEGVRDEMHEGRVVFMSISGCFLARYR